MIPLINESLNDISHNQEWVSFVSIHIDPLDNLVGSARAHGDIATSAIAVISTPLDSVRIATVVPNISIDIPAQFIDGWIPVVIPIGRRRLDFFE